MVAAFLFGVQSSSGVPLYRQLIEQVRLLAASGRLRPGDFLPTVRQVAQQLTINPMTVSKAYSLLERDGVVELVRGRGMRLRPVQVQMHLRARLEELRPLIEQLAARACQLAVEPAQVMDQLQQAFARHGQE